MQGIGLQVPSRSLGWIHLGLAGLLVSVSLLRPPHWLRTAGFTLASLLTLLLPVAWVGPLWSDPDASHRLAWGFYASLTLSLAIPFGITATVLTLAARRGRPRSWATRLALPLLTYLVSMIASYPVTLNYALLYPLIR